MADSAAHFPVVEVNEANFTTEVEQSSLPVFVDFWAPWCGPCRALAPLFEQLAEAYRGQVKFAKINTDENEALAQRFNIRTLPTLLLLRNGQLIEDAGVARSKSAFANFLDKHAQHPLVAKAAPQRTFRAFHGDATLRESVVARLRDHVQAGRIVKADQKAPISDADLQRYSLMGAALNDADIDVFENTLGIPGSVGRLQESVHGLLLQREGDDEKALRLQSPHDAWPLDWWRAIPPGTDLQTLPSRFIAWLLTDRSVEIYPYALREDTRGIMASLANLHLRSARSDAPSDEEWRAVRSAAGELVKRKESTPRKMDGRASWLAFEGIEMLAWPSHELDDALPFVISSLRFDVSDAGARDAYTFEQWAERCAQMESYQKAFSEKAERLVSNFKKQADIPPEVRKEMEELQAQMRADVKRCTPLDEAGSAKATLAYGERLHVGLMLALKDTVSGA